MNEQDKIQAEMEAKLNARLQQNLAELERFHNNTGGDAVDFLLYKLVKLEVATKEVLVGLAELEAKCKRAKIG